MKKVANIEFPGFSGKRCLMMPYIQGDPESVPQRFREGYQDILETIFIEDGERGFLTIDESPVKGGTPHRGARARHERAIHTEAGRRAGAYAWGWGISYAVALDEDVQVLIANNIDNTCALWDSWHIETTRDGDIGHLAKNYPYKDAVMMKAGEVFQIGILTPHESLPIEKSTNRQFFRILGSGVHGRESYFTQNELL